MIGVDWIAGLPTTAAGFDISRTTSTCCQARCTPSRRVRRRRRRTLRRSFATCACGPAQGSPMCSWWTTTPSSRARCCLGQGHGLSPHRRLGLSQEHQRQGRARKPLRAYANGCKDEWDSHPTLAVFAIINMDYLQARRQPDALLHQSRRAPSPPARSATRRPHHRRVAGAIRAAHADQELLVAAQAERKANSTRAASTECCDRTLLRRTKELLDAADIGKLRPGWDGPFTVTACPSPKAAPLALTRGKMCCSPTVNVDRLKPFFARAGTPPAPGQVSDAGQEGEHEAELLLNRRMVRGVTRWLTRLPLIFNWRPSFGGSSSFGGGSSSCSGQLQAAGNPMMSCRISTHHLVESKTSGNPAGCSHCSHKPFLPPHERPQLLPTHHGRPSPSSPSASCSWTGYAISTPST